MDRAEGLFLVNEIDLERSIFLYEVALKTSGFKVHQRNKRSPVAEVQSNFLLGGPSPLAEMKLDMERRGTITRFGAEASLYQRASDVVLHLQVVPYRYDGNKHEKQDILDKRSALERAMDNEILERVFINIISNLRNQNLRLSEAMSPELRHPTISCPHCAQALPLKEARVGKKMKCQSCKKKLDWITQLDWAGPVATRHVTAGSSPVHSAKTPQPGGHGITSGLMAVGGRVLTSEGWVEQDVVKKACPACAEQIPADQAFCDLCGAETHF